MRGRSTGAYVQYLFAAAFAELLLRLPSPLAYGLGNALGWLWYILDGRHRRIALENLTKAFDGKLSEAEIQRMARSAFMNLAMMAVETCRSPLLTPENLDTFVAIEGREHYMRAKAKGKGILWITAHLGPWELLPLASALKGEPLSIVVRPLDNPYLDEALNRMRTRGGNRVIAKRQALRAALEALGQGGSVAVLIDQNITRKDGVFVEFFGRLACTAAAPAVLALRTGASVLPAAIFRRGRDRYTIVVEKELTLIRTGNLKEDLVANTALFTRAIEELIRRAPDQWFWVHRRWKTQPQSSP